MDKGSDVGEFEILPDNVGVQYTPELNIMGFNEIRNIL